MDNLLRKGWVYILFLIASIACGGGMVYYFYALNVLGVLMSVFLALVALFLYIRFDLRTVKNGHFATKITSVQLTKNKYNHFWPGLYLIFFSICLLLLTNYRTAEAIISPWEKLPEFYFLFYSCASAILVLSIYYKNKFGFPLVVLHSFLSFSVATIIYRLGYGYDPFIHNATIDLIKKTGSVDPKPFYYLGQYALILIFNKLTAIPVFWLDKLLVPVLSAVFLPLALIRFCRQWFEDKNFSYLTIALLFVLPYSIFISTTPQNLAYLFLLLAVITGLTSQKPTDQILIFILSLAALITQPVAGIPALIFSLIIFFFFRDQAARTKNIVLVCLLIILSLSIPSAFYFAEKNISQSDEPAVAINQNQITTSDLLPHAPNQEKALLNLTYTYIYNVKFLIVLLAATGLFIACKHRQHCRIFLVLPLIAFSLLISYFLTTLLPFRFLINYERADYALRILNVVIIFLLPLLIVALYAWTEKINKQNIFTKISFLLFFVALATAAHYYSYPRFDNYFNSHGYAVSADDIEAVRWINKNAGTDHIVLANQQVSAAAVKEFGFTKYFKNDIFYYPIPTGGPLYPYFLDMVYKEPSRVTMFKAMDLAGVRESYFVLNRYWWAFPKILAEAKLSADSWQEIGNGQIFIFRYKK